MKRKDLKIYLTLLALLILAFSLMIILSGCGTEGVRGGYVRGGKVYTGLPEAFSAHGIC